MSFRPGLQPKLPAINRASFYGAQKGRLLLSGFFGSAQRPNYACRLCGLLLSGISQPGAAFCQVTHLGKNRFLACPVFAVSALAPFGYFNPWPSHLAGSGANSFSVNGRESVYWAVLPNVPLRKSVLCCSVTFLGLAQFRCKISAQRGALFSGLLQSVLRQSPITTMVSLAFRAFTQSLLRGFRLWWLVRKKRCCLVRCPSHTNLFLRLPQRAVSAFVSSLQGGQLLLRVLFPGFSLSP